MAFRSQKISVFITILQRTCSRYSSSCLYSSNSLSHSSTSGNPSNHNTQVDSGNHLNNQLTAMDESPILRQLSSLLPISHSSSTVNKNALTAARIKAVDGFLPPEDKLRGVFLQKLRGKTAVERALMSVDVELTVDLVSKVVNRGSLSGDDMVTFFNWAIEQPKIANDIVVYQVILKALGRRKFLKHMVEILNQMRSRGINPNSETLLIILDSYIRVRQISKAVQIFTNLETYGFKCDTESFNVLLQCLCRRSHVSTASSLLVKMKYRVEFNSLTYNIVISGWSRLGRVSEVERILKEMVNDGFGADCLTYSYILEGLGRSGRIGDAIEIYSDLEKRGCLLNAVVYNSMISNFISVGDIDESLKYYERMLCSGCKPDAETYVRVISGFLKAKRVADAIEMFDEMLTRGIVPSTGTVTDFIKVLCSYGPPHAALMIYQKARESNCTISITAYKMLLMRLSRFGKCGMLMSIWNEMQESGYSSDMLVYEYVINGLCNTGQLENAVLLMEEALHKEFYPSRLICSKLNNCLLKSNKVQTAYRLFLKIKKARGKENARRHWRAKGWHF